ncbi:hypothetical protein ECZU36_01060 [Escherichia coli]|nr:hypothetical protein ECZU36_01060 [Escherichia coli]
MPAAKWRRLASTAARRITLTTNGTQWTYTDSRTLTDGSYVYRAGAGSGGEYWPGGVENGGGRYD